MNTLGKRQDGTRHDELIVRVYADPQPSQFTLYEDDGVTTAYQHSAVRTTVIAQQRSGDSVTVRIEPASGMYDGAPERRHNVIQLVPHNATAVGVSLNGVPLAAQPSEAELDASDSGWHTKGGVITAKSVSLDVLQRKVFEVRLRP